MNYHKMTDFLRQAKHAERMMAEALRCQALTREPNGAPGGVVTCNLTSTTIIQHGGAQHFMCEGCAAGYVAHLGAEIVGVIER